MYRGIGVECDVMAELPWIKLLDHVPLNGVAIPPKAHGGALGNSHGGGETEHELRLNILRGIVA